MWNRSNRFKQTLNLKCYNSYKYLKNDIENEIQ